MKNNKFDNIIMKAIETEVIKEHIGHIYPASSMVYLKSVITRSASPKELAAYIGHTSLANSMVYLNK